MQLIIILNFNHRQFSDRHFSGISVSGWILSLLWTITSSTPSTSTTFASYDNINNSTTRASVRAVQLDCCNSLHAGRPLIIFTWTSAACSWRHMQCVLSHYELGPCGHITRKMTELRRLLIEYRVQFKLRLIVHDRAISAKSPYP